MMTLIYVFIIMALIMGLFCMFVTARDIVNEEKERRKKNNIKETAKIADTDENQIVEKDEVREKDTEEVSTNVIDDSSVVFSTATQTLEEKYLELSSEYKEYYDKIVKYANAVEGSKRYKNESFEEYKVGKSRLVRLKIKRGIVICELVIPNLAFKTYVADKKIAMKQAPSIIKVVDEDTLAAVKDSIDIAVKALEEEKAYKKEQAKLRRKEKRENTRKNNV